MLVEYAAIWQMKFSVSKKKGVAKLDGNKCTLLGV